MELENFKEVANYPMASKALPGYIKEVFTRPQYGLKETENDNMHAWFYLKHILSKEFNFSELVKKSHIVNIDIKMVLTDARTHKDIRTWDVNINSDHNLHYEAGQGPARKQRPHYGFTIQRNDDPNAVATSVGSLDATSKHKHKVVAHLYLPEKSHNPTHFRMKNDVKSKAAKVTPCCRTALHPRQIVFMGERTIALEDKRRRSMRSMRISATCETHDPKLVGPILHVMQKAGAVQTAKDDASGHSWLFWVAAPVLAVPVGLGLLVLAFMFAGGGDDDKDI